MTRYRWRPVVIDAIQFTGDWETVQQWCVEHAWGEGWCPFFPVDEEDRVDDPEIIAEVWDKLHSTWVGVKAGQWIIRGIQGEYYPCDPDVFEATYERADGSDD